MEEDLILPSSSDPHLLGMSGSSVLMRRNLVYLNLQRLLAGFLSL